MKNGKNPWPWAIILTFVLFICGTVCLVVMACAQRVDLVSANYYEDELKFQKQLDRLNRARQLEGTARVTCDNAKHRLTVSLPPQEVGHDIVGQIQLYRPSAAGLDRQVALHPDSSGLQALDASSLAPGLWKVRVFWTVDQQDYLIDQKVVVAANAPSPQHRTDAAGGR